jgi:rubrerythrin
MTDVSEHDSTPTVGRRHLLRVGGLGVATAAIVAACGNSSAGEPGRVGVVPPITGLPDPVVNDIVLLRTASSLEHSAISIYDAVAKLGVLKGAVADAAARFREDHLAHAAAIEALTKQAGGSPWTCGNPRVDNVIVAPVLTRIVNGVPATADAAAVAASDDPLRDVLNFAQAVESWAGATYQSLVPLLSEPSLRRSAMLIAGDEVRHAALLALTINTARPGGYVSAADVASAFPGEPATTAPPTTVQNIASPTTVKGATPPPPPTEIPTVIAIPGQFGSLAAIPVVVGAPDANGSRLKASLETLSLNSLVYEYLGDCPSS